MNINRAEGVPDFVLLEEITEAACYDNLKLRFNLNHIYVCIFYLSVCFLLHVTLYLFVCFVYVYVSLSLSLSICSLLLLDIHWRCGCVCESLQEAQHLLSL